MSDIVERLLELKLTQVLNHTAVDFIDEAADEIERLREALSAVLADMPRIDCDHLHHAKKDQHRALGPCPVETRLEAAIARARTALEEEGK